MNCPRCNSSRTRVIDSRPADEGRTIRRRRECEDCSFRFTTFERVAETPIVVVKKDGTREEFSRDKLLRGVVRSAEKRPISMEQMENLVADIARTIQKEGDNEIPSSKIGDYVMERLIDLDEVAYIRFASVYRQFTDVSTFMNEVKKLQNKQSEKYQSEEQGEEM